MEGAKLLFDALTAGSELVLLLATQSALERFGERLQPWLPSATLYVVEETELKGLANTKTPQGLLAAVRMPERNVDLGTATLLTVLEGVQDPGNVGTMIRLSLAYGADAVLLSKGSADVFNPKVIRASAGSVFRIPVRMGGREAVPSHLRCWFAVPRDGLPLPQCDLKQPVALVFGNEGAGLLEPGADRLTVPMVATSESLNVAMAAAACLYETRRQRLYC